MFNTLGNTIPTDWARRYTFDGNGNSTTGSNNATVTNPVWIKSQRMYQSQCLSWGATTSCTYASVTYTNSYIWIYSGTTWTFTKNSSKVTATALNGVNGERYAGLTFFNRTLTENEEQLLQLEGQKLLGPTNIAKYPKLFEGLVGYWDFRGTAHNLVDGVAGTVTGATLTTDRFGNSNSAYSFDGVNDMIDYGNNYNITGDITLSAWIYATKNNNHEGIISKSASTTTNVPYELRFNSNNGSYSLAFLRASTSDYWFWLSPSLTSDLQNKWAHIVVTNTGGVCKLYVNGDEKTMTLNRTLGTPSSNSTSMKIGTVTTLYFGGNIGFSGIFNKALSSDEVKLLYNLTSQDYIYPNPSYDLPNLRDGLIIDFNGSYSGNTYYDNSGNGYTFTGTNITNVRQGKSKIVGLLTANDGSIIQNTNLNLGFSSTSSITMNKWVKTGYTGTYGNLVGLATSNNFGFLLVAHNGTYQLDAVKYGIADQFLNSGIAVDANKWRMITGIFNNGTFKIYIDGILKASSTYTTNPSGSLTPQLVVSRCTGTGHTNYHGGTRIRNRVLSDKEIQELYYSQKGSFIY